MVQSGQTYTAVGTIENAIYFWGTRYGENREGLITSGTWSQSQSQNKLKDSFRYTSILNVSNLNLKNHEELVLEPKEILA